MIHKIICVRYFSLGVPIILWHVTAEIMKNTQNAEH